MKTVEYAVRELEGIPEDDMDLLNAYGKLGFELVTIIQVPTSISKKLKFLAYLKITYER